MQEENLGSAENNCPLAIDTFLKLVEIKRIIPMWLRYRLMDLRGRGVYSHFADDYRCIFIHIPKAAGTSVALTLFGQGSRHVPWFEYKKANPWKFKRYFKFTFVRNPWDRLVSSYFFLRKGGLDPQDAKWAEEFLRQFDDFDSFVRGWVNEENIQTWVHFMPQHYFICDPDGKVMVDFVGRVENMENDFAYVASKLGCSRKLDKVNTSNQRHYSSYYDEETREIVRRVYARDIELFDYGFEEKPE
jgi:chondroitin 4-sulfotransferase 11